MADLLSEDELQKRRLQPNPAAVLTAPPVPTLQRPSTDFAPLTANPAMARLQEQVTARTDPLNPASKPGVERIHNPWARVPLQALNAIGSAFAPGLTAAIPGTTLHHRGLIAHDTTALQNAEKLATEEGTRAHLAAETGELPARAEHEAAQAESLRHPVPKTPFELFTTQNPNGTAEDWAKFQESHRPIATEFEAWAKENPGKPVADFMRLKQQNAPEHNETAFDVWRKQNPNAPVEDWLRASTKSPQNEYEDFKAAHPELKGDALVREYTRLHQAPEHPKTELVAVPGPNGTITTREVGGGVNLPAGTRTVGGVSSENVKADEQAAAAQKAREDATKEYGLAQQLVAHPSPTNDVALVMRYIGATKPDSLGKLRLNQNEISLVMGTRNALGDLDAFVNKIVNGQRLTDKQRHDMLDSMKLLTGQTGGGQGAAGGPKEIKTQAEYDALPSGTEFLEDGKHYRKP